MHCGITPLQAFLLCGLRQHLAQRILTVPLGTETITHIVRTLHYDGVLELVPGEHVATWRIAGYQIPNETAFTSFPCGVCPVRPEP